MDNKFSSQLNLLRRQAHLSQTDLANKVFVTRQSVSKWERGDSVPDLDSLIKLSEVFNVDLNELVFGIRNVLGDDTEKLSNIELIQRAKEWLSEYLIVIVVSIIVLAIFFF